MAQLLGNSTYVKIKGIHISLLFNYEDIGEFYYAEI